VIVDVECETNASGPGAFQTSLRHSRCMSHKLFSRSR